MKDDGYNGQDRESYSDTQDRDSYTVPTRYQITSVLPFGMFDTIIRFRAQPLTGRFGKTVIIAVDHRPARELRAALASGIRPIVEPEDWQVMG